MTFPEKRGMALADYVQEYSQHLNRALRGVDCKALEAAAATIAQAGESGKHIYACGNGGSAAISDHLACDHFKGVATHTGMRPKVHSLSANGALNSAIANDISFKQVFAYQINVLGEPGDVLVAVSSSGNSDNIIEALAAGRAKNMHTIALVGFHGGRAKDAADIVVHVDDHNYGIVEDAHQAIMHILAQYIRLNKLMPEHDPINIAF